MARAKAFSWLGIVTGLVFTPAALEAAPVGAGLLSVVSVEVAPAQTPARPSRASLMLTSAIECHQRGEYEGAATLFHQCQAVMNDLSAAEQQKLSTWVQTNAAALKARQDATALLRQSEQAQRDNQAPRTADLLKRILPNSEYLKPAEKERFKQYCDAMQAKGFSILPAGGSNPAALAHAKLQQGRTLLAQGNFSAAEQLAHEAQSFKVPFAAAEDSPAKLLDDCAKTQKDPKALLAFAHAAFEHKDYDRAEQMADMADKEASTFTFALASDCPTKLLKEIQVARAPKTVANAAPAKPAVDQLKADTPDKSEIARQLLKQGREAFKAGDMAKAKTCADQAKDKGADLKWWDDTPEKLLAEIQRTEATKAAAVAAKDDPRVFLKQARDLFAAGKLEDATAANQKLKVAANSTKWGLFEDSPERLQKDIESARLKRDQEESVKVMADGRGMLERGDLDKALQASFRAEKLHGPYSILDLGDRPQKLRADIETAKAKTTKISVPPVPGAEVAKNDKKATEVAKNDKKATEVAKTDKKDDKKSGPSLGSPIEDPRGAQQAKQLLVDARVALKTGDLDKADNLAVQAERLQGAYKPGEDTPAAVRRDVQQIRVTVGGSAVAKNPAGGAIQRVGSDAGSGVKKQAVQMLAEAQQYQHAGRLIEARQKALEAQRLNAAFAADEVRPEQVLLELASLARQRIDSLMLQSNDCMSKAGSDVSLYSKAESNLQEAKQLAASFGQDTLTINSKIEWVKQTRSQTTGAPLTPNPNYPQAQAVAAVPNDGTPRGRGMELLAQVDVALRSGDTVKARRLAEEAYQGSFGVQAEATAKLRSIDAEEEGQRRLAMNRTFDAGQSAYNRKDYSHAANILQSVDARMLDPKRQNRMREIMQTAEMQNYRPDKGAVAKVQYKPDQPGVAKISDSQPDYLTQVQAMQEVKFQKLREEGLKAQRLSAECFKNGETDRALEVLNDYLAGLNETQLDAERITLLKRPVEARLSQFKMMKGQRDQQTAIAKEKTDHIDSRAGLARAEQNKQAEIAKLMKQYNILFKEGKYEEAEQQAMLAHELDPDNPMVPAAVNIAKMARNRDKYQNVKDNKAEMALQGLDEAEDPGKYTNTERFDADTWKKIKDRKEIPISITPRKSDSEKQIERSLNSPVTLNFKDTSLGQVLQDLRTWQNINIWTDDEALAEEQVSLDRPISMQLDQVKLKSALNLLLKKVHLTYVVEDDVLKITNEAHARGRMVTKVYTVADLVIPIENYSQPAAGDFMRTSDRPNMPPQQPAPVAPYAGPGSLGNAQSVGSSSGSQASQTVSTQSTSKTGPSNTREDQLISLITNTVSPKSWASSGGQGTIDYHPLTLSLAINQTPDIQEQIADLLAALRRLQDQEVAVEVRFISVAEGFYERIGVDFNINIPTGDATSKNGALLAGGNFTNGAVPNVFDPGRFLTGLTPTGSFTPDLDIPIKNSSFGMAVPPFGGFPNIPGANGGVSMGLAFFSDIQVFLFMEAAQGDTRTNVMQAPKVTLFNGQTSTITINDQQFFTTNVQILTGPNGQPIFVPQNVPSVTGGSTLTVQAVITADRRFVRLSLNPTLTNLASAVVPLLPTTVIITPTFEGGFAAPPIAFTQFLQQPGFNTINVQTTVMVPDGGTILMGGLKRLSEGRNEFGPPVLSKIPYINRLFKNVGYGREAESLLIMVTPRIIIQEEEETRLTGVVSSPPQ